MMSLAMTGTAKSAGETTSSSSDMLISLSFLMVIVEVSLSTASSSTDDSRTALPLALPRVLLPPAPGDVVYDGMIRTAEADDGVDVVRAACCHEPLVGELLPRPPPRARDDREDDKTAPRALCG